MKYKARDYFNGITSTYGVAISASYTDHGIEGRNSP